MVLIKHFAETNSLGIPVTLYTGLIPVVVSAVTTVSAVPDSSDPYRLPISSSVQNERFASAIDIEV